MFKLIFSLIFLLYLSNELTTQVRAEQPSLAPDTWVSDYDYSSSLINYLKLQHDLAVANGDKAFVYFFNEDGPHCNSLRRQVQAQRLAHVFEGTRMVMLDIQHFRDAHERDPDNNFDPGNWSPLIAHVNENGIITGPVLYPDVYLWHPERIPERKYRRIAEMGRPNSARLRKLFVKRLKEYFAAPINQYQKIDSND